MRYILIACLITGCSAAVPTVNQRDAVRTYVFQAATQSGATSDLAGCMSAAVDKMSDADISKSYRLMSSAPMASIPELWTAVTTCRSN